MEWKKDNTTENQEAQWVSVEYLGQSKYSTDSISETSDYPYVCIVDKLIEKKSLPQYTKCLYEENIKIAEKVSRSLKGVEKHISTQINTAQFPAAWSEDNVQHPTVLCIDKAVEIGAEIFKKNSLIPLRSGPSIEEGVMLTYWNDDYSRSLKIEIYNNLEVAALVNQGREIVKCVNVNSFRDIFELVDIFLG